MPKEEWGVKRVCPTTGRRFYDLNRDPVVSPYTGEIVEVEQGRTRMISADAEDAATVKAKQAVLDEEDVVLEDDVDVDLEDDILEDDDDDNVSLDEIADVSTDDEE